MLRKARMSSRTWEIFTPSAPEATFLSGSNTGTRRR
jgi:hypothetical protein